MLLMGRFWRSTLLLFAVMISFTSSGCFLNQNISGKANQGSNPGTSPENSFFFPVEKTTEDGASLSVNFKVSGDLSDEKTIYYELLSDTALAGEHFVAQNGSFILNNSNKEKNISVTINEKSLPEGQSLFFYVLWKEKQPDNTYKELGQSKITIQARPEVISREVLLNKLSTPESFYDAGTYFLYTKTTSAFGKELWRSDGTVAGTYLLKDICPGTCSSTVYDYVTINGFAYIALSPGSGTEIWKTDGTPTGTNVALTPTDIGNSYGSISPESERILSYTYEQNYIFRYLFAFNNKIIFFSRNDATFSYNAFASDGTPGGTERLFNSLNVLGFALNATSTKLFLHDGNVWASDGTPAGTTKVSANSNSFPGPILVSGNYAFTPFSPSFGNCYMLRTDGTGPGTVTINNVNFSWAPGLWGQYFIGGRLYYIVYAGGNTDLWSVGTSGATAEKVLTLTGGLSLFGLLGEVNATQALILNPGNGSTASSIYLSNGTVAGTTKILDLPELTSSGLSYLSQNGKALFGLKGKFSPPGAPYDLWISDGSPSGTTTADSFFSSLNLSNVELGLIHNNKGILWATHSSSGKGIWETDLTSPGTNLKSNYPNTIGNQSLSYLFLAMDSLWFSESTSFDSPAKLTKIDLNTYNVSNATVFDTTNQSSFDTHSFWSQQNPYWVSINDKLYFISKDNSHPRSLMLLDQYTLDYTPVLPLTESEFVMKALGTKILFTDNTGIFRVYDTVTQSNEVVNNLIAYDEVNSVNSTQDKILFRASNEIYDQEAWVTDGTALGTDVLVDFNPSGNSAINITTLGNSFLIGTDDKLFISDGTSGGTSQLASGFTAGMGPTRFFEHNGKIYFAAGNSATTGSELWVTDGTPGGTQIVKDIYSGTNSSLSFSDNLYSLNGKILFYATESASGKELWSSDGTTGGTQLLKDIYPGSTSSDTGLRFGVVNSKLLFFAYEPTYGREIWSSDGTNAGTQLVKDLCSGNCDLDLDTTNYKIINDKLYFWKKATGEPLQRFSELWVSDGTSAGTQMVADISPYYFSQNNYQVSFVSTNRYLYFTAKSDADPLLKLWRTEGLPGGTTEVVPNNSGINPKFGIGVGEKMFFIQELLGVGQVISVTK